MNNQAGEAVGTICSGNTTDSESQLLATVRQFISKHREPFPVLQELEQEITQWEQAYNPERLVPLDQYEEDCYNGVAARQRVRNRLARKRMQAGVELYVGIAICPSISPTIGIALYNQTEGKLECSKHTFWSAIARLEKLQTVFTSKEVLIFATCEDHPEHIGNQPIQTGQDSPIQKPSSQKGSARDIELLVDRCTAMGFSCTIAPPMKKRWTDWEFRLHTKKTTNKVAQCIRDATRIIWGRWL